jgi:hypothetical protein
MSVTNEQPPQGDAAAVAPIRPVRATGVHVTSQGDDPSVATIREALAGGTARSFKKSLNTCLIIWAVGRSRTPRRRVWPWLTLIPPLALAVHYWHALSNLVHLLH